MAATAPLTTLTKAVTWSPDNSTSTISLLGDFSSTSSTRRRVTLSGNRIGSSVFSNDHNISASDHRLSAQLATDIFLRESLRSNFRVCQFSKSFYAADLQFLQEEDAQVSSSNKINKTDQSSTKVKFAGVEIREYPIIPGNSPAGNKGPPLTIDWVPASTVHIADIEKYEEIRAPHRRSYDQLSMPASQRMDILRKLGLSRSDIQKQMKQAAICRRRRKETLSTLKHQATYEKLEAFKSKTLNVLTFGQRNKSKRLYLQQHCPSYYSTTASA